MSTCSLYLYLYTDVLLAWTDWHCCWDALLRITDERNMQFPCTTALGGQVECGHMQRLLGGVLAILRLVVHVHDVSEEQLAHVGHVSCSSAIQML